MRVALLVGLCLATLAPLSYAGPRVVAPRTPVTVALDTRLAKKYPGLAPMLRDPDAFYGKMERRFEAQKRRAPGSPYDFDFSELGMPLVHDLHRDLSAELVRQRALPPSKERDLGIDLLGKLVAEAQSHVDRGSVGYRPTVELAFFASRALGHFHADSLTPWQRSLLEVDRHMQGFKGLSIEKERELYETRSFGVFQTRSTVKTMREAAPRFERAFANPQKLESLWIPSNVAIDQSVLMRLMPKPIEIVGVTNAPIMADGFRRPAGDFWMHDVRHSSLKAYERKLFIEHHGLSEAKMAKLDSKADEWNTELAREVAALPDKALRKAIQLLSFNFHHDRGYVVAPSSYLDAKRSPILVAGALYFTQKIGGEGVGFRAPVKNFRRADAWLREFWRHRLPDEQAITSAAD